jgi:hypothetical protein
MKLKLDMAVIYDNKSIKLLTIEDNVLFDV